MRSTTADRSPRHPEAGGVTAEFAAALPVVAVILVGCIVGVQLAGVQVRATDAAAVSARSVARGESAGAARSLAARIVPGASVSVGNDGDLTCATVRAKVGGAGPLSALRISARSCALAGGR